MSRSPNYRKAGTGRKHRAGKPVRGRKLGKAVRRAAFGGVIGGR